MRKKDSWRKLILLSSSAIFALVLAGAGCNTQTTPANEAPETTATDGQENTEATAGSNQDVTANWIVGNNTTAGFTYKYPSNVNLTGKPGTSGTTLDLSIEAKKIDALAGPSGYDKDTALASQAALGRGEYGPKIDWALETSQKVVVVGDKNAQKFAVLSRFEVCDVTFERKLLFYNQGYQVTLTLYGPKTEITDSMPEYFTTDLTNCGEAKIWNFEKRNEFYQVLDLGKGPEVAQNWFNTFDQIVDTIKF